MLLISPAFLCALAAVSLPLWLHLTRRGKYREMPMGTLRFLREVLRERRRRARFDEIPLLLLRLLAVVLLALLFTRPVWPRAENRPASVAETIVLLDASGSVTSGMADAARAAAQRAVSAAGGGMVTLAQFSDAVESIDSLAKYQPRPGAPTNVQAALDWALDRLQTEGRVAGRVVLIGHLAAASLPAKPPRVWPQQFGVELVPLILPTPDNAAVRQVTLLSPFVTEEMELEARVVLPPGAKNRTVTVEADGVKQSVVAPSGAERVSLRFPAPSGEVRGWVSVAGKDPWPADNRRPFVARWTEQRRVLLVDGRPGSTPFDGQAYFLREALAASGAAHGKSPFRPEIVFGLEGNQGMADLSGVGAVALCGVEDISPGVARALAEFVRTGGGLVIVLNERWTPRATALLVEAGLFPEHVTVTEETITRKLDAWDRSYPPLAPFDGREGGDLRDLKWRDGFDLRADKGWRSLASLDGGHPVLLMKENAAQGAGSVLVIAHPLTRAWTDLPIEPLFVPLMKNLFATVARVPPLASQIELVTPGLHEVRVPGLYDQPDGSIEVVAADPVESLIWPVEPAVFRAAFGFPEPGAAHEAKIAREGVVAMNAPDRAQPGEWWPWLALGLCAVLMIENLVATRSRVLDSAAV